MILVYGANGYTGSLIAEECARRNLAFAVGGRRADALAGLAAKHRVPVRVASLDDAAGLRRALDGVTVVIHGAGPFFRTSPAMVDACLDRGVHYLDITGEVAVFEKVKRRHTDAAACGIVLLPGVGFDVVPTDCLAAQLAARVPAAVSLELAIAGGGGVSRGTARTMFLGLGHGSAIRQEGRLVPVPLGFHAMRVPFHDRPRDVVSIPWGDLSTAFTSTGIPNIRTYSAMGRGVQRMARIARRFASLLALPPMRRLGEWIIDRTVAGPDANARATRRMQVWGRVTAPSGATLSGVATTPEGYAFTASTAVECAVRVRTLPPSPGYHTPSTAFGAHFLDTLPECVVLLDAHLSPVPS